MFRFILPFKFYLTLSALALLVVQAISGLLLSALNDDLLLQKHNAIASKLVFEVDNAIVQKQKSTAAIALALAEIDWTDKTELPKLVSRIKQHSDYNNLWIQLVSPKGESLYRSWSALPDQLFKIRPEYKKAAQAKEPVESISTGRFDLSLKIVVPLIEANELKGFIDLISHFNSIQTKLSEKQIDFLVLATPERSRLITHPFSAHQIGDFYVSNLNPAPELLQNLDAQQVQKWVGSSQPYHLWEGSEGQQKLVVVRPLKASDNTVHGHYIVMANPNDQVAFNANIEALNQQKFSVIAVNVLVSLFIVMALFLWLSVKQRRYYQTILNSEDEAVLVTNGKKMLDANNKLFTYFPKIKNSQYRCICEFFEKESGFLQTYQQGQLWVKYVIDRPDKEHKAKVCLGSKTIIFQVKVSYLDVKAPIYVVVLSDITQLEMMNDQLLQQSRTDAMTQTGNRRNFDETIYKEIRLAARGRHHFSLMTFDIDYFKQVNDYYGHAIGDQVLKHLTQLVKTHLRASDNLYRVGGEEFMVILHLDDLEQARQVAEKIRLFIEQATMPDVGDAVTASFGVTAYQQGDTESSLLDRADKALYYSKDAGRNRVTAL